MTGLLTALAADGFSQLAEQLEDGLSAAEVYVDFGLNQPVLFSLMFDSPLPDFDDPDLDAQSELAFSLFLEQLGAGPDRPDVSAMITWSRLHGLVCLLNSGRMRSVLSLAPAERRRVIGLIARGG